MSIKLQPLWSFDFMNCKMTTVSTTTMRTQFYSSECSSASTVAYISDILFRLTELECHLVYAI